MSLTQSTDHGLGSPLPEATLGDPYGRQYRLASLAGTKGLLIAVTCNHCPYAQAVWPRVIELARRSRALGIATVAVNPNLNPAYPDDSIAGMRAEIDRRGIDFPYLADADQALSRALGAVCTPEFFLYDKGGLVYHGRLDDNWKEPDKVTHHELRDAIEALATGRPVPADQKPSLGCSIKWL
jgi:peroxiredoxin